MKPVVSVGLVALCLVAVVHSLVTGAGTEMAAAPDVVDLNKVSLKVIDVLFVDKLEGANGKTFEESEMDEYRGMVMTVEVQKPADEFLSLYAQDFALHYRFGDDMDVAPCQGISGFSASRQIDRPMYLNQSGRQKTTTGVSTAKEPVVYVDLFFMYLEPGALDLHLVMGQPIGAGFKTDGWSK